MRPDHAVTDARVDSLVPLYYQPRFLAIPSALALLLGGAWAALRRMERNALGERERKRLELIRSLQQSMSLASARGDAAEFINSASSALRQSLGARWQLAPEQITLDEIDARQPVLGLGERRQERRYLNLDARPQHAGEPHIRRRSDAVEHAALVLAR